MEGPDRFIPLEGGWGWVVCIASFWVNGTVFGILNSFGVFLVAMLADPDLSKQGVDAFTISWIGSLAIGLVFLLCTIASIIADKIGCRKTVIIGAVIAFIGSLASSFSNMVSNVVFLFITYGLIFGTGASLAYMPSMAITGHYFEKRIGFVNGLVTAGSGVFTIVLPVLLEALVKSIGLWNTLRFVSGLVFLLIFAGATFKEKRDRYNNQSGRPSGCKELFSRYFNFSIWKKRDYKIWCAGISVGVLGYFVPFVHLVNHVKIILPNNSGAVLITCLSITSTLGRVIFGRIADIPGVSSVILQQISVFMIGAICMLIPVIGDSFAGLVVAVLVMGLFDGGFVCMFFPIASHIVGGKNASQAFGFMFGLMAVSMTLGPPIAGLMYDIQGTYNMAFTIAGVAPLLGASILFLIKPQGKKIESAEVNSSDV